MLAPVFLTPRRHFMKRLLTVLSVTVLALIVSSAISAQSSQSDPRIGTWKLNVEKSNDNTRKSDTRTYTQSGDSVTAHIVIVNSDGNTQVYGYTGCISYTASPLRRFNSVSFSFLSCCWLSEAGRCASIAPQPLKHVSKKRKRIVGEVRNN